MEGVKGGGGWGTMVVEGVKGSGGWGTRTSRMPDVLRFITGD